LKLSAILTAITNASFELSSDREKCDELVGKLKVYAQAIDTDQILAKHLGTRVIAWAKDKGYKCESTVQFVDVLVHELRRGNTQYWTDFDIAGLWRLLDGPSDWDAELAKGSAGGYRELLEMEKRNASLSPGRKRIPD